MSTDDGGNAFPQVETRYEGSGGEYTQYVESVGGMTLRDYFAAKAMQSSILALDTSPNFLTASSEEAKARRMSIEDCVARSAYDWADAMLRAREE
jgi:hypothetical protein